MIRYSLELALHGLRRSPKSTVLAIVTVALGLAASMTTLALLHQLSADPLPGRSQNLYLAWVDTVQAKPDSYESLNDVTHPDFKRIKMADAQALVQEHRAVRQAALAGLDADVSTTEGEHVQKAQSLLGTTSELVPMFGVALRYGRNWSAAEDAARAPVAVIDVDLAQKLFGTGNVVGRSIRLDKTVFRVIGVSTPFAPQPHFFGLDRWAFSDSDLENVFVPYTAALDAGLIPGGSDGCDDKTKRSLFDVDPARCAWLAYWVELDTPQQVADYRTYLDHYAAQQPRLAELAKPAKAQLFGVSEWLAKQNVIPDNARMNVWLAMSFLLLCMANVAGLLTAKFLRRSGEIGIRRALGAPRRVVFMQYVLEATAVSALGGAVALPLTLLGLWIVRLQDQGFTDLARLDPLMFAGLFALSLLVGVLVGVVPAWRASTIEPGLQVKSV
ncbi:antimicrobial peptide ABC transporter permease [Rhodanobacter fulvus Jip2]|uniref:Antimicrobial peptide ABC transporter permease n=1 Tax=Rhodanobacter fulvus Jip2 TaxID=1163408 RepID=I4VJ04_9GAMM|nr:ABC transporter permease [Rhodanobacter fulvus]EIL87195.1 antimicrobial peptide ABC transporter permease [Rhodanobacter fulvus Jip2]